MEEYDVIILGAGPAGLFSAYELIRAVKGWNLKICIIDENKHVGGMGLRTDGKLNFDERIGIELDSLPNTIIEEDISYVREIFENFGLNNFVEDVCNPKPKEYDKKYIDKNRNSIYEKSNEYSVEFIEPNQVHVGSDCLPKIMKKFHEYLEDNGVDIFLDTKVYDIVKYINIFRMNATHIQKLGKKELINALHFKSKYLIVCPGRNGAKWFRSISDDLKISYEHKSIDVGIRVETHFGIMNQVNDFCYDPKFIYRTKCHGDKVRTFCNNPNGYVVLEKGIKFEDDESLKCVNGHAYKNKKSNNTNFSILVTTMLTEPYEDMVEFGKTIMESTYRVGGGKPIVQRLGDLMRGSRSTVKDFNNPLRGFDFVYPTLDIEKDVTPGDLHLCYYSRFVNDIKEFIGVLDNIIPGLGHPSTLLYAPEVKFWVKYHTENMETTCKNLYVAGDGCGKSRGIVGAALSGVLAADCLLNKMGEG